MANYDEEVLVAELVERLHDLGFTEYEAHTLIALMRLGTGTAKDVADIDNVPRTRVYDAVETLHERGLVDILHATPRKFTVISTDSIVRKLDAERRNTLEEVASLSEQLAPATTSTEELGAFTVSGRDAVAQRVFEFVDEADEEVVYMTVDELLTEAHLDHLRQADDRGVGLHIADLSDEVRARILEAVPSASVFETLWEWADTPAGSLLIVDREIALVSVRVDDRGPREIDETAIWGRGERNSLVVVLRSIFAWRLDGREDGRR